MLSRRSFIKHSGTAAALLATPILSRRVWAQRKHSPNDRINIGIIGPGGMGTQHLRVLSRNPEVRILAVCDVDRSRREEAKERVDDVYENEDCAAYNDYREVLAREDIDAVVIATPDHWHVPISIAACRAGKDVYCEKPSTHTIHEGQELIRAVRAYRRIYQAGTQQRSSAEFRQACGLVRAGALGTIHTVRVFLPLSPVGQWPEDRDPPPGMDWDFWLGVAPWAPFNPARHPAGFRFFWDYSGGSLTDWGQHHLDSVQWALGTDGTGPVRIEGVGTYPSDGIFETFVTYPITYEYANGVRVVIEHPEHGVRFEGSEGWIHVWRGGIVAEPAELLREDGAAIGVSLHSKPAKQQDWEVWASPAHHQDWLEGIRNRTDPVCTAEVAHRSVSLCHLGNIAMRLQRALRWDPVREIFPEDDEANRFLARAYRDKWIL